MIEKTIKNKLNINEPPEFKVNRNLLFPNKNGYPRESMIWKTILLRACPDMSDQAFWSKSQGYWFYFNFTNLQALYFFIIIIIIIIIIIVISKFACQFMCSQKRLLILKTVCITRWFQWIMIFLTLLLV